MNVLSLCSGIGGLDLGVKRADPTARTLAYVEIDPFCQRVLLHRMLDGELDPAPIVGDLRQFDARPWHGVVDCVLAGYPCQPFSVAGKRGGRTDPRHLWPQVARVVAECDPTVVFLENVAGHLGVGCDRVVRTLDGLGYVVAATLCRASDVGAPHRRERLFVLAYAAGARPQERDGEPPIPPARACEPVGRCGPLGHALHHGPQGQPSPGPASGPVERADGDAPPAWPPGPGDSAGWAAVLARWPDLAPALPPLRRVADGPPPRVDRNRTARLRALGNAVVPAQATLAWRQCWGILLGD